MDPSVTRGEYDSGLEAHTNERNGFRVVRMHYSCDPSKDAEWAERMRKRMPADKWDQEYEMRRVASSLLVHPDFDEAIHVIDGGSFQFHSHFEVVAGIDPGFDHPFAAEFVAIGHDGRACVVAEHCERATLISEHVRCLVSIVRDLYKIGSDAPDREALSKVQWVIDPSQAQIIHELREHGIFARARKIKGQRINDVGAGVARVGEWLRLDERGVPRLQIIRQRAPGLIAELKELQWERTMRGQPKRDKIRKIKDDRYDALRYALMWRPRPPVEPVDQPSEESIWSINRRHRRWRRQRHQSSPFSR